MTPTPHSQAQRMSDSRANSRPLTPSGGRAFPEKDSATGHEIRIFASWEAMEAVHAQERAEWALKMFRMGAHGSALKGRMGLRAIHEEIALKHDISSDELRGPGRPQYICDVRHEAWYRQRLAGFSFPQIGKFYRRDHTTILSGVRRHAEKLGVSL